MSHPSYINYHYSIYFYVFYSSTNKLSLVFLNQSVLLRNIKTSKKKNLTCNTCCLWCSESESLSVVCSSLQPHQLHSPRNSPGQNIGVGSLSLLQGSFPTQGSNPDLLDCRRVLYQLSYQGSPWAIREGLWCIVFNFRFPGGSTSFQKEELLFTVAVVQIWWNNHLTCIWLNMYFTFL